MKTIKFLLLSVLMLAMAACGDDAPEPIQWECPAFDQTGITVNFTPEFYIQAQIAAKTSYSGEVTLVCVNYPEIILDADLSVLENIGCKVTRTDPNTLRFEFLPVFPPEGATVSAQISIIAKNGKQSNITNLQVARVP